MKKRIEKVTILRREKKSPYSDFWHTLQIGVPVAVVLFFILPPIFQYFAE